MGNCDKSLRITTYVFFILLLITEVTAIVSNIMCFCKEEQIVLEITNLISLILSIISILSITIFGIHSLYFRKTTLLLWYIIISSIFLLIQIGFVIWVIMKEQSETVLNTKLLIITKCVCAFFYFITIITSIILRNHILKESEKAPLALIDETLTEDMYKNILSQGKNPNDAKLVEEFDKLFNENTNNKLFRSSLSDNTESTEKRDN